MIPHRLHAVPCDVDFITDESACSGSRQDFRFSRIPENLGEFRYAVIKSTFLAIEIRPMCTGKEVGFRPRKPCQDQRLSRPDERSVSEFREALSGTPLDPIRWLGRIVADRWVARTHFTRDLMTRQLELLKRGRSQNSLTRGCRTPESVFPDVTQAATNQATTKSRDQAGQWTEIHRIL